MLSKLLQLREEMAAIMVAVDGLIKESSGPELEVSEFERFRRFVESENENLGEMLKRVQVAKFEVGFLYMDSKGNGEVFLFVHIHMSALEALMEAYFGVALQDEIRIRA